METPTGVDLLRRYVDAVNRQDVDAVRTLFAPGFVNHTPSGDQVGLVAFEAFLAGVWAGLPDIEVTIDRVFEHGDRVGTLLTLRGTSTRFERRVTVPEIQIYRIADGRLAERWFVVDRSDLRPAPAPAP